MNRHELETLTIETTDLIGGYFEQLQVTDSEALHVLIQIIAAEATICGISKKMLLQSIGDAYDQAALANELSETPSIH